MKFLSLSRLLPVAAAAALTMTLGVVSASPATAVGPAPVTAVAPVAGAVFVLTNDVDHNSVISYDRAPDGTLTKTGTIGTGGSGAIVDGAAVDPLASQGALTLDRRHRLLFAVNGGSDTVTVFGVSGSRLARRQVLSTRGDLPVSVSVVGNLVYVLNARDGGSIVGYRIVGGRVVPLPGSSRSLGLTPNGKPEFLQSPSQVAITPDQRAVVVATKTHGTLLSYTLDHSGRPAVTPVTTASGAVPFALSFDRAGRLLVVDATGLASSYRVGRDAVLTELSSVGPTGQAAACWSIVVRGTLYAANAGSDSISAFTERHGRLSLSDATAAHTDGGPIDMAASRDGRYLYQLSGADGTVETFHVGHDGSLTAVATVGTGLGLAAGRPLEGLAAS